MPHFIRIAYDRIGQTMFATFRYDKKKRIIRDAIERSPVRLLPDGRGGSYPYSDLPEETLMSPRYRRAVADSLFHMLYKELRGADIVALPEAKGFVLASVADKANCAVGLIRKKDHHDPRQVVIKQKKAYQDGSPVEMYCLWLRKGDEPDSLTGKKVVIIDDFAASGGTATEVAKALESNGMKVAGIGFLYADAPEIVGGVEGGVGNIYRETGIRAKVLATLKKTNESTLVESFYKM